MWRFLILALAPVAAQAGPFVDTVADVYVLGEVHDNPVHHAAQADAIRDIGPRAVVFEMLTPAQAAEVRDDRLDDPDALGDLLGWEEAGWPDFNMYYPIVTASRGAAFYGAAVPREEARNAMEVGVARAFGEGAVYYGLEDDLPAEQLADRLNLQMDAHCGQLPVEMLPGMVDLQRLRDATLARTAIRALDETGGPGRGHHGQWPRAARLGRAQLHRARAPAAYRRHARAGRRGRHTGRRLRRHPVSAGCRSRRSLRRVRLIPGLIPPRSGRGL